MENVNHLHLHPAFQALDAVFSYSSSPVANIANVGLPRYDQLLRSALAYFSPLPQEQQVVLLDTMAKRHGITALQGGDTPTKNTFGKSQQEHYDRVLYYIFKQCPELEKHISKQMGQEKIVNQVIPRKMSIDLAERDYVVVKDFKSEKGYEVMTRAYLKEKYPKRSERFGGTKLECQAWMNASDEAQRAEIEKLAEQRHHKRVVLPSEERAAGVEKIMAQMTLPVQTSLFDNASAQGKGLKI